MLSQPPPSQPRPQGGATAPPTSHDGVQEAVVRIKKAVRAACGRHDMKLVALSGGLDSSIIAWHAKQSGSPAGIAVVTEDFVSPDLEYCQMAASGIGMPLSVSSAKTADILDCTRETVRILENFNEIEIRNNVVMYMAAKWAADNGYDSIATGDGADELFAGYKFMVNTPQDRLAAEIDRICSVMHFPSHKICRALGVTAVSPFLDQEVVEAACKTDAALKVRGHQIAGKDGGAGRITRHGKWILRKAFEDDIPYSIAWRPKAAMQDGSGTAGLAGLFESAMRADEKGYVERLLQIKASDGITIRNRESLYYYEIFRELFGTPADYQKSRGPGMAGPRDDAGGDDSPHTEETRACPYCRYVMAAESRFCRMCAAFPI